MREKSRSYRDLLVWQMAHNLVLEIYKLTKQFPREEMYTLTTQLIRAAISVPANLAEGFNRKGIKDKLRFYNIACGSLSEVDYFLLLTKDLNYAETSVLSQKVEEVTKMLNKYTKTILSSTNY